MDMSETFNELKQGLSDTLGVSNDDFTIKKPEELATEKDIEQFLSENDIPQNVGKLDPLPAPVLNSEGIRNIISGVKKELNPIPTPAEALVKQVISAEASVPEVTTPIDNSNKSPSSFTEIEKENVIASFVVDQTFFKEYTFGKTNLKIVIKTISDEDQESLNNAIQKIELQGDRRKHAYTYGNGSGEEYETVYNVDQLRAKRLEIMSYHLHGLIDSVSKPGEEGREFSKKVLLKLPTNLVNAIYTKCMIPFLDLVEEACRDVQVFSTPHA
jgi:hypothetical protein